MTYNVICTTCSTIIRIGYYNKSKLSFPFIQCPKCKKFKFKIQIVKGISHHISCKITCTTCESKMALEISKVKSLSFPFIQCPKCKRFKFKMEIIKGNKSVVYKLRKETKKIYEKYDKKKYFTYIKIQKYV